MTDMSVLTLAIMLTMPMLTDKIDNDTYFDSTSLVSPCNKTLGQIYLFNADPIKNIFGFKLEPL